MPFGFDSSKKKNTSLFTTQIKNRDELAEITVIAEMLNPDDKVLLVAKQSRIKPGGSYMTPNIVYATDRRIIRDPYMLGLENIVDIPYDIPTNLDIHLQDKTSLDAINVKTKTIDTCDGLAHSKTIYRQYK